MVRNEDDVPMLDRDTALGRVGGDMDLLREIGALFLHECAPAITDLRKAVAARDAHAIELKAHSLKGSVSTFGTGPAFQAAQDLERLGRNRDLTQVESNLQSFESSLARLCAELQAFLSDSTASE